MKKQSTYASKCIARSLTTAYQQRDQIAAQAEQALREAIQKDVRGLQIDAGLHSWTGNDASTMTNLAGRLCFLVAFAAGEAGFTADHPDMRIVRGLSEALADLAANLSDVERYRASIQSGLAAIDRLLPQCDDIALALAAQELDRLLTSTQGLGTEAIRQAMGITA